MFNCVSSLLALSNLFSICEDLGPPFISVALQSLSHSVMLSCTLELEFTDLRSCSIYEALVENPLLFHESLFL